MFESCVALSAQRICEFRRTSNANESGWPHQLPASVDRSISLFQRLVVLRCLHRERFRPAVLYFIRNAMGPEFTEFPSFDLSSRFETDTAPLIPGAPHHVCGALHTTSMHGAAPRRDD